ncbi:MAG: hypothetical protein Q7R79_02285 [bacterium]|nr:hypothetical protein [bacterium]
MSERKRFPVLTATTCNQMENLRLAIEVFEGKRVRFIQIDFNTDLGRAYIGEEEKDFGFHYAADDVLNFWYGNFHPLDDRADWNSAYFDWGLVTEVRVSNDKNPNKRGMNGQHPMCWVGRSSTDRREEPVWPDSVEYWAKKASLTVEEYLKS